MCCGRASAATLGPLWWMCYGRASGGRTEVPEPHSPTVEEVLWATQGSLWPVCCGRAKLGYSGITLGSVLWKSYFGLLRDHFGQCAVEELLWATQGSLWPVCCGRANPKHPLLKKNNRTIDFGTNSIFD